MTSGNTHDNIRNMESFIRQQELTRGQIVSITSNETDTEDGENVLTLIYRKKAIHAGASPLDNIKHDAFNNMKSWDAQLKLANSFTEQGRKVDIISISRTPKNIGMARC